MSTDYPKTEHEWRKRIRWRLLERAARCIDGNLDEQACALINAYQMLREPNQ